MSCRRVCRELLWATRFGEIDAASQPHLEHLAGCRSCRDEVGFDRAMVERLRTVLARRIDGATPSPDAWAGVLARARGIESHRGGVRSWIGGLASRLRVATAIAGSGLTLVLALNTQAVPVSRPAPAALPLSEAAGLPRRAPADTSTRPVAIPAVIPATVASPPLTDLESESAMINSARGTKGGTTVTPEPPSQEPESVDIQIVLDAPWPVLAAEGAATIQPEGATAPIPASTQAGTPS